MKKTNLILAKNRNEAERMERDAGTTRYTIHIIEEKHREYLQCARQGIERDARRLQDAGFPRNKSGMEPSPAAQEVDRVACLPTSTTGQPPP